MRIAFFDAESDELSSQQKGRLFEKFTARVVELCGYRDVVIRAKRASLEYDIEANSALHDRKLYGEAKAHEASMSGKEASAFVGKLLPLAVGTEGIDGLFISTSPFTPEAEDYLRSLSSAGASIAGISLRTLAGGQIAQFLNEGNICISEAQLREKAAAVTGLAPCDAWITVADRGDFFIVTLGQSVMSTAANFAAFSLTGDWISLSSEEARRLAKQISDLEELRFVSPQAPEVKVSGDAQTLPTVVAGSGWFDYKFPSPPECFIGREAALVEIDKFLTEVRGAETSLRAAQVLSRSGVGKGSLLLKVAASDRAICAVTVDGRNLRVPSDLRLIAAELVELVNQIGDPAITLPVSQDAIRQSFTSTGSYLRDSGQLALIQIDQFEALLSRPAVFQSVLDLLIFCTTLSLPIAWIMARKNDLAATYDESAAIDLSQMNELSRAIKLDDFSPPEEQALLDRLAVELGAPVSQTLSEALLTFSAGFPWLLKRVCAHVLSMSREGVTQANLSRGGLRAEDLFNEDLAGLEEGDKALLKTLAANMPNTASELSRRLEGEVSVQRLTQKLNEFLGRKLLRLSGDVYDTLMTSLKHTC
ncbi:restriction endonuclease [Streptomyces sp. UG1]|uniref:restriction endonuclease n=1 Tax=Streptomyces sp. UG1 TaxID=3417652 RepID=UPI003CE7DAEE